MHCKKMRNAKNIEIKNWTEFVDYFGGTSPLKYKNGNPKYELPYIAKSYLEASNRLNVVRVLGLSGYNAGPVWVIKDNSGNLIAEFTFILYGDVDGDGNINIKDALHVRKNNLGTKLLTGIYLLAGDVDRSGDGVNIKDALILRKFNLGQRTINQQ